jgi:hypothetical protein
MLIVGYLNWDGVMHSEGYVHEGAEEWENEHFFKGVDPPLHREFLYFYFSADKAEEAGRLIL